MGSILHLSPAAHIALEYVLGFGFGWTIFQALFMRDMAGGSFRRALSMTFIPEFLSMNVLMAGMLPVMTIMMANIRGSDSPQRASFWFVMSMALFAGAILAYPINWWLVAHHLKHGMMTIARPETRGARRFEVKATPAMAAMAGGHSAKASKTAIVRMAVLSVVLFGAGLITSAMLPGSH